MPRNTPPSPFRSTHTTPRSPHAGNENRMSAAHHWRRRSSHESRPYTTSPRMRLATYT